MKLIILIKIKSKESRYRVDIKVAEKILIMSIKLFTLIYILSHLKASEIKIEDPCNDLEVKHSFKKFKEKFNKNYKNKSEDNYRFRVFCKNKQKIDEVNNDPTATYELGVNEFSDLLFEEFANKYLMTDKIIEVPDSEDKEPPKRILMEFDSSLPNSFDWRNTDGAVNPVRNQGDCGSCWAFSAVSSMENALWRAQNISVGLSEQELVDCSSEYGNGGCNGGWMTSAYRYVRDNGISTELNYPYNGLTNDCRNNKKKRKPRYSVTSFPSFPEGVLNLQRAVVQGVVSIAYNVGAEFQSYKSGVFNRTFTNCESTVNHGMNVVGYHIDADPAKSYFIVRNSWGTNWGEQGYIKIVWGSGVGNCNLAKYINVVNAN